MQRTNPTFRQTKLSEEEVNDFIDEMFANLFDNAPIDSDTDKVPNLADFRGVNHAA